MTLIKTGAALVLLLATSLPNILLAQKDLDTAAFDRSVRVQDDLFEHVNGTWLKTTEIPADKSNYGSFTQLDDLSRERIRDLILEVSKQKAEPGTDAQKVGDFYNSFMDLQQIEADGVSPLAPYFKEIDELTTHQEVLRHFGYLQTVGVASPCGFFVAQDAKDSTRYLCQLIQSGISLPDRDYYLKTDDEKSAMICEALKTYIVTVFDICSLKNGQAAAADIFDLETKLAAAFIPRVELRNAEKRYNLYPTEKFNRELTPHLEWQSFLSAVMPTKIDELNINTPSYFSEFDKIFTQTPVDVWKQYLRFRLIDAFAPILTEQLTEAHFQLHSAAVAGISEQQPRWKRAVNAISGRGAGDFGALGDVVGRLYVAKHFPPVAKQEMDKLVKNLLIAFENSIDDLTWMTDTTKKRANEKLSKINTKIGYTKKWRDYSDLNVDPNKLFGNVVNSNLLEFKRMTDHFGKPVDREQWEMTPQTVNAYYNPALNEIVFPAAILQSPFFSENAEAALNYGGIGAVIGHEISHAFDDQGSKYDGDGNLNNWWTDEDRAAFKELTDQLIAQYSEYQPLAGKNVNGRLTLGENIADLSGLSIAHKAYRLSLGGSEPEKIAGWTGDQLFFVGWSRVWRRKYRQAEMVRRLLTDSHSPSQYRANGPVSNIDVFYSAFDVKPEDGLFKPESERIRIW